MGDCLYNSLRRGVKVLWPRTATKSSHRYSVATLAIVAALSVFVAPTRANSSAPARGSAPEPYIASHTDDVQVLAVRSLSQVDSSQVFIDLTAEVRYKVGHLSNPERVYLDFPQTEVHPRLTSRRIVLQNGLVDQIRIGTSQGPVTRVVL